MLIYAAFGYSINFTLILHAFISRYLHLILYYGTINRKINSTPQRFLLAHFEVKLDFSHSEFTCT